MWVFGGTDSRRGDDSEINTSAKTDVESKCRDDSVESTWTKDLEAGFSFFAPLLSAAPSSSYSECKNNRECVKIKKKKKKESSVEGEPLLGTPVSPHNPAAACWYINVCLQMTSSAPATPIFPPNRTLPERLAALGLMEIWRALPGSRSSSGSGSGLGLEEKWWKSRFCELHWRELLLWLSRWNISLKPSLCRSPVH